MRLDSVSNSESESDTSMVEEDDQEEREEEVHMKDLLGNEEEDVEEAASHLMPADVVEELVGESDTAAEVQREVSRPGSGFANLWQDGSLFTQELCQKHIEKQERLPQTKSPCGSEQLVVTLEEEMN